MLMNYKEIFDGKEWTLDAKNTLVNLLEVWDSNHYAIICSPEKVFKLTCIDTNTDVIHFTDWDNIVDEIKIDEDSFINYMPDVKDSWGFIHHRLSDDLSSKKNNKKITYLTVVEVDNNNDYLVRGIIEASKKKIRIAYNPIYELYRPKSIWEKQERLFSDDSISLKEFIRNNNGKPKHLKK